MAKGKFGGDAYKPRQLGPEPSSPSPEPTISVVPPEPVATQAAPALAESPIVQAPVAALAPAPAPVRAVAAAMPVSSELEALRAIKVPFSSRITAAAERQLKGLSREGEGRSQTELLAEALNLLFKKHGRDQVA